MASPYRPLSAFYFLFFAVTGSLLPFWPVYLESLGFVPVEIGTLIALVMVTKIVAPNLWGWIADRDGRRMRLVRVAAVAATLVFAAVTLSAAYWWIATLMVLFSFFWNSSLPQFEVVTLNHLGRDIERYTRIRLWGSVGFVVAVVGLGAIIDDRGAGAVPVVVLILLACAAGCSLVVADAPSPAPRGDQPSLLAVLRQPGVAALLAACFLMQAGHGPYYTFYSIYLEDHGYSSVVIGGLWALGVLAEVVIFVFMHRLVARWGLRTLFLLAFGLTGVRWILVAYLADSAIAMVATQCLHAASFGLYHGVAIQLVHRRFVASHQGRGQALYSSLSFGAGGALGALLAGYAWEGIGPTATWVGAGLVTLAAMGIVWRYVERPPVREVPGRARLPLQ